MKKWSKNDPFLTLVGMTFFPAVRDLEKMHFL